jgi:hypothetical protein
MNMRSLWVALALACCCAVGLAQGQSPPTGEYTYQFGGDLAVWDVSGSYSQDILGGEMDSDFTLAQDGQGKITGTGHGDYWDEDLSLNMDFTVKGSLKDVGSAVQCTCAFGISGTVEYEGKAYRLGGSFKYNLEIDQLARSLYGTITGKLCISGMGCASLEEFNGGPVEIEVALADADMDGSWELTVNLSSPDNRKIIATAAGLLSNGVLVNMAGKGKYNAATDQVSLSLAGDKYSVDGRGAKLKLSADASDMGIIGLSGKVKGQGLTLE